MQAGEEVWSVASILVGSKAEQAQRSLSERIADVWGGS
jgi:hypothetical protein